MVSIIYLSANCKLVLPRQWSNCGDSVCLPLGGVCLAVGALGDLTGVDLFMIAADNVVANLKYFAHDNVV